MGKANLKKLISMGTSVEDPGLEADPTPKERVIQEPPQKNPHQEQSKFSKTSL